MLKEELLWLVVVGCVGVVSKFVFLVWVFNYYVIVLESMRKDSVIFKRFGL